jgi:acetoin utilization deacetylase AcuC-like enzyme
MSSMSITDQTTPAPSVIEESKRLRVHAQQLIELLRNAQQQTRQRLDADAREDAMEAVKGTSSFDEAIASVEHTRDVLDRAIQNAKA